MIGFEELSLALTIVTLFLVVVSVPTLALTVRSSSKQLKRYQLLRSLADVGDAPVHIQREWDNIRSTIGYTTAVVEDIERLGATRPVIFQIQIASVLTALLLITGLIYGFMTDGVAVFMLIMLAACLLSVRYGNININRHVEEYSRVLKQLEENGSGSNMYG
ncbi:MAG: hypothetical protein GX137_00260 [Thermoplasmatales archaeon]|nr:hypothetical protein [Thermoplasmatales archaeon]